ncbi:MAG: helix-hairpin-helix domain-containing protein [bacterium]|nr:helix-hairpin-helix domain-containing protein [bacterium]
MKRGLREIPGVGVSIEKDLQSLGIQNVSDLNDKEPEEMCERLCTQQGVKIDRRMLYVFRCTVYYASHTKHDPELLKWWNWKDKKS